MYYSISETAILLGVHWGTIRKWDREGKVSCIRPPSNHRRIYREEIERIISDKKRCYKTRKGGGAIYGRVLVYVQKNNGDLDGQVQILQNYCSNNNWKVVEEITDLGSGLKTSRR